jgi:hypothetical protein
MADEMNPMETIPAFLKLEEVRKRYNMTHEQMFHACMVMSSYIGCEMTGANLQSVEDVIELYGEHAYTPRELAAYSAEMLRNARKARQAPAGWQTD